MHAQAIPIYLFPLSITIAYVSPKHFVFSFTWNRSAIFMDMGPFYSRFGAPVFLNCIKNHQHLPR